MENKGSTPRFVKFSILTTITIVIWVGFEIYRSIAIKPGPVVPPFVTRQINPNLDTFALEKLQDRLYIPESDINDTVIEKPEEELGEEEIIVEEDVKIVEDEITEGEIITEDEI